MSDNTNINFPEDPIKNTLDTIKFPSRKHKNKTITRALSFNSPFEQDGVNRREEEARFVSCQIQDPSAESFS